MLCFSTTVAVISRSVFFADLTKHFLPSFNFRSTSEVGRLFHNVKSITKFAGQCSVIVAAPNAAFRLPPKRSLK